VTSSVYIAVETALPVQLLKRDGKAALVVAPPTGWLGLGVHL
jgi:hypothetical protein